MNRRDFLRHTLAGSLASSGWVWTANRALAAIPALPRTLVNVMLLGGADLRFLFTPADGSPYADAFWTARQPLYAANAADQAAYPDYTTTWNSLYTPVSSNGQTLGIHNTAAWLVDQYQSGNVAIVCNTIGSDNRRHDHSQLIVNTGDPTTSQYLIDRDGWGGRLAATMTDANVVSVTDDISVFCGGFDSIDRNSRVVHAPDTRAFGLSNGDGVAGSSSDVLARGLKSYYSARRASLATAPADWPFRKFLQHEAAVRGVGDAFNIRLNAESPIQPATLAALYTAGSGTTLNNSGFGRQCANLYDSCIASDLFHLRVASLEYTSWDTHNDQKARFENNIADLFGAAGGLATLDGELGSLGLKESLVYVFNTDFGRQLAANGANGTDHGRGNYLILVGNDVRGGIYGNPFPESEIPRFNEQGADILGQTSFERVLASACDWLQPGSGSLVFPGASSSIIEPGVGFDSLFV